MRRKVMHTAVSMGSHVPRETVEDEHSKDDKADAVQKQESGMSEMKERRTERLV